MKSYEEMLKQKRKEFNEIPIYFAFSEKQFKEQLKKLNCTEKDLVVVFDNGFMLKSEKHLLDDYLSRPDEIDKLMRTDPKFAEGAFYYEMCNHEYHINHYQGDWDVCRCFGDVEWQGEETDYKKYLTDLGFSDQIIKAYAVAKKRQWRDALKNDWF